MGDKFEQLLDNALEMLDDIHKNCKVYKNDFEIGLHTALVTKGYNFRRLDVTCFVKPNFFEFNIQYNTHMFNIGIAQRSFTFETFLERALSIIERSDIDGFK